jgi:tryptophan synthase alpha chain
MGRIEKLFAGKKEKVLNVYCTAGYPHLQSTMEVMQALQEHGADIIELGMPYSDPLADGPVIQQSSTTAIANGMSIPVLLEQLKNFRDKIFIPVILMGYMNPVLQYGFEKFCKEASSAGIDGLIIPDLPEIEFETIYGPILTNYELDFVFLVTPETSRVRIKRLDNLSTGFIYAVSSSSTTGQEGTNRAATEYLNQLKNMRLRNPVLVGFGIHDKEGFEFVSTYVSGAIIGSAYIKALENTTDVNATTKSFISSVIG